MSNKISLVFYGIFFCIIGLHYLSDLKKRIFLPCSSAKPGMKVIIFLTTQFLYRKKTKADHYNYTFKIVKKLLNRYLLRLGKTGLKPVLLRSGKTGLKPVLLYDSE